MMRFTFHKRLKEEGSRQMVRQCVRLAAVVWLSMQVGCAALHPLHGISPRMLPPELRGTTRAGMETIDLSRLRQTPPCDYRLDTGDVLTIHVDGVMGDRNLVPPVNFPLTPDLPPSIG